MLRSVRLVLPLLSFMTLACASAPHTTMDAARWWKGNLHTHSLWSDGDDFPESIVGWYADHGYDFIALSDHNILAEGEKWVTIPAEGPLREAFERYREALGDDWIDERIEPDREGTPRRSVRLRTLEEYRGIFEQPGRFLILQSEEISDRAGDKPIHVNATNVRELIPPQGGDTVLEVMQNNVDAVIEQRDRLGEPMFPHINHPNYVWAVTAEDLIALQGEKFFEVYNGHPLVHVEGDATHPGTDRLWDIVLTERLAHGDDLVYGLATDDAHHYTAFDSSHANPGRGWVMVRAARLTPDDLIDAMEKGDFYASTGVVLDEVRVTGQGVLIRIRPEEGVTYVTRFMGTRRGFDNASEPVVDENGDAVTRRYSDEIGTVLAQVAGISPHYEFRGDELYVRAKVVSSKPVAHPVTPDEVEIAWTQPVRP